MNSIAKLALVAAVLTTFQFAAADQVASTFHSRSPYQMDLTAGIIVGGGDALPGFDSKILARLNTDFPLYAGGELGLFFLTGGTNAAAVIPILGTIFTPFDVAPKIHMRMGVSAGPVLATGGGFSTARFAFLFDPVVLFDVGGNVDLNAQVRFGVIGSAFVAMPQVGITFAI